MMSYKQGDIVWLNARYTDGSGEKERPLLVISNSSLSNVDEVIAIKISKTHFNNGYCFRISEKDLSQPLPEEYSSIHINSLYSYSVHTFSSRKKPIKVNKNFLSEIIDKVADLIEIE